MENKIRCLVVWSHELIIHFKVQRGDLTCDVIRNSLQLCFGKIWILIADWSMLEPVLVTWHVSYKIMTLLTLSFLSLSFIFSFFFSEISWKVIIYFELRTSVVNCIEKCSWNKSMYCSSQTIIYDAFVSSIVHFKKFVIFALDNILKNTSQNWRSKKIANTSICSHW